MYISCPSCSTSFNVSGVKIGTGGRIVRCFNCSHTWQQYPLVHQPQAHFVPVQYLPPGQFSMPPQMASPIAPETQYTPPSRPEPIAERKLNLESEPARQNILEPELTSEDLPSGEELPSDEELDAILGSLDNDEENSSFDKSVVEEVEKIGIDELENFDSPDPVGGALYDPDDEDDEEETKASVVMTLVKVLVILIILGGVGAGAVFMRIKVVDLIPASNIAFDLIGLRVAIPGEGLKLQSGSPTREDRDGKEVIVIKGSITNISDVEQQVPEILIRAIDAKEQVVQTQTLRLNNLKLAPDKSEKFTSVFKNLGPAVKRLDVTYGSFIEKVKP
jgi:predicted Zn finger-like uncharacterized protein